MVTNPRSSPLVVERVRYDAATGEISTAPRFVATAGGVAVVTIHAHHARELRVPLRIRDQAVPASVVRDACATIVVSRSQRYFVTSHSSG